MARVTIWSLWRTWTTCYNSFTTTLRRLTTTSCGSGFSIETWSLMYPSTLMKSTSTLTLRSSLPVSVTSTKEWATYAQKNLWMVPRIWMASYKKLERTFWPIKALSWYEFWKSSSVTRKMILSASVSYAVSSMTTSPTHMTTTSQLLLATLSTRGSPTMLISSASSWSLRLSRSSRHFSLTFLRIPCSRLLARLCSREKVLMTMVVLLTWMRWIRQIWPSRIWRRERVSQLAYTPWCLGSCRASNALWSARTPLMRSTQWLHKPTWKSKRQGKSQIKKRPIKKVSLPATRNPSNSTWTIRGLLGKCTLPRSMTSHAKICQGPKKLSLSTRYLTSCTNFCVLCPRWMNTQSTLKQPNSGLHSTS